MSASRVRSNDKADLRAEPQKLPSAGEHSDHDLTSAINASNAQHGELAPSFKNAMDYNSRHHDQYSQFLFTVEKPYITPNTKEAVMQIMEWQRDHKEYGLVVDGCVGPNTLRAGDAAVRSGENLVDLGGDSSPSRNDGYRRVDDAHHIYEQASGDRGRYYDVGISERSLSPALAEKTGSNAVWLYKAQKEKKIETLDMLVEQKGGRDVINGTLFGFVAAMLKQHPEIGGVCIKAFVNPSKNASYDTIRARSIGNVAVVALRSELVTNGVDPNFKVSMEYHSTPLVPPTAKDAEKINTRIELFFT
jgi:hypothetical protein